MDNYSFRCRRVLLTEVADIERAVKGKIYPQGTIYIQVSAARRTGLDQWRISEKEGEIENKFAVLIPKNDINPYYLLIALERSAQEFLHKYVGTNINIQMDAFKRYELDYHADRQTQELIADFSKKANQGIESEKKTIEALHEIKKYMLGKMMC